MRLREIAEVNHPETERPAKLEDVLFVDIATRWRICSKYAALPRKGAGNPGGLEKPGVPEGVRGETMRRWPLKPWGAG